MRQPSQREIQWEKKKQAIRDSNERGCMMNWRGHAASMVGEQNAEAFANLLRDDTRPSLLTAAILLEKYGQHGAAFTLRTRAARRPETKPPIVW